MPYPNGRHEAAFVGAFIVPERQERTLQFLANLKKRSGILDRFNHRFDFRDQFATQIERQAAEPLADLLRSRGAGVQAYIIGCGREVDGSERPLLDAINLALEDGSGVIVSCIPGKLALLIQEFPPGEIFLLRRD